MPYTTGACQFYLFSKLWCQALDVSPRISPRISSFSCLDRHMSFFPGLLPNDKNTTQFFPMSRWVASFLPHSFVGKAVSSHAHSMYRSHPSLFFCTSSCKPAPLPPAPQPRLWTDLSVCVALPAQAWPLLSFAKPRWCSWLMSGFCSNQPFLRAFVRTYQCPTRNYKVIDSVTAHTYNVTF